MHNEYHNQDKDLNTCLEIFFLLVHSSAKVNLFIKVGLIW